MPRGPTSLVNQYRRLAIAERLRRPRVLRVLRPKVTQFTAVGRSALVVVEYGRSRSDPELARVLRQLPAEVVQHLERVRTDVSPGQCLAAPNEAFEFSGYQEGLERLLADTRWAGDDDASRLIVFVNDTITSSHATMLSRFLMTQLLALNEQRVALPALVGLTMGASGAILAATGGLGYVSTYAFALFGRVEQLRQVRFYQPDEVAHRFAREVLPRLPADYVASVRGWLEPLHPLMGWHNAIPGRPLEPATRLRKQLAIHLEHTMPQRLHRLGFSFVDLGSLLTPTQRLRLRLMRLVDRLYINRLKLRVRLPQLLGLQRR